MIQVQIYIKKNTLVESNQAVQANTTPFLTLKSTATTYTTNQFTGHYVKIISGTGLGAIAYIVSNTSTTLTLQTAIQVDTTSKFEIYRADYQKLDLFSDEKISVTSSVANANDIGKIFTDYSQSFTIPASDRNNKILSHWYESAVDGGYDHRQRYDGYVEIDTHKFKDGNFQLEKANKKNGFIESYTLTFYGNLTQLKDRFKDTKLKDLPTGNLASVYGTDSYWGLLNHTYNSTEIINRIKSVTPQNVYYPLIGSQRKFSYKDGVTGFDITTSGGAVKWNELFPAVSMQAVFSLIQLYFGVTFTGTFFNLDQWKKLYLYLKNSEKIYYNSEPVLVDFTSVDPTKDPMPELDLATNVLTLDWSYLTPYIGSFQTALYDAYLTIYPTVSLQAVSYTIYVYKNNLLFKTFQTSGNTNILIDSYFYSNTIGEVNKYHFKVSSNSNLQFDSVLDLFKSRWNNALAPSNPLYTLGTKVSKGLGALQSTTSVINIVNYVPDITVNDFITGVVKAFNLMIIPKDLNTFEFIPLEMYYNQGKVLDITKYVYADEMDVERPKLFKAINFQYEKSNNILNNAYRGLYNTEYGDLIYTNINSNESSNYDIKLPFENVLFEKTLNYQFETATLIDKDLKPYTPKPMLIYKNGTLPTDFVTADKIYVTTEGGFNQIANYNRFSNEYDSLPADQSHKGLMTMNFSNEQSPWYNSLAPNGLYNRHYKNYIDNLYNIKTRVIKCKALFPPSLLGSTVTDGTGKRLGIELNDRLIIRNKRYIINNMTTDLTTGEANLELLTDYRGVNAASSVGYKFASTNDIIVDNTGQTVDIVIYKNDYDYFGVKASTNFLSYPTSGTFEYNDLSLTVTIPANSTGNVRYDTIGIEYYTGGVLQLTEYIITTQLG